MEDHMSALEMLEEAVLKSSSRHAELRKRADDIYDERVGQIARAEGCGAREAHAIAASDSVASRAYSMSAELAERERLSARAGMGAAAYID